jgi:hypothetical protein
MDKLVNFFKDFKYLKLPVSTLFAVLGVLLAFFYISTKEFKIKANEDSEVLVIDAPK